VSFPLGYGDKCALLHELEGISKQYAILHYKECNFYFMFRRIYCFIKCEFYGPCNIILSIDKVLKTKVKT
jgi:hypothetical protein